MGLEGLGAIPGWEPVAAGQHPYYSQSAERGLSKKQLRRLERIAARARRKAPVVLPSATPKAEDASYYANLEAIQKAERDRIEQRKALAVSCMNLYNAGQLSPAHPDYMACMEVLRHTFTPYYESQSRPVTVLAGLSAEEDAVGAALAVGCHGLLGMGI